LSADARDAGLPFVEYKALLFAGVLDSHEGDKRRAVETLERCLPSQLTLGHVNLVAQELCPRPELASLVLRRHKTNGLGPALMKALSCHWRFPEYSQVLRELCQSQVRTWIDLVTADDRAVSPRESAKSVEPPPTGPSPLDDLTRRERQVLALMADQHTNAEIGRRLFITLATVKSHVNHILGKMGQTNRLGAVLEYQRLMRHSPPGDRTDNQPWV
jgi:DNA-binding CsgD family transcriptional regulator